MMALSVLWLAAAVAAAAPVWTFPLPCSPFGAAEPWSAGATCLPAGMVLPLLRAEPRSAYDDILVDSSHNCSSYHTSLRAHKKMKTRWPAYDARHVAPKHGFWGESGSMAPALQGACGAQTSKPQAAADTAPRAADDLFTVAPPSAVEPETEETGPFIYSNQFHAAIRHADRMVIRDGGFDCCRSVDRDKVLATVTNKQELAAVYTNLQFETRQEEGSCECCGYPCLDWYRGTNRLALTGVQHGEALRWKGFPTDAELTTASRTWLRMWLKRRGIDTKASPTMRVGITNDTAR